MELPLSSRNMCTQDINYYKACGHGIFQRSLRHQCSKKRAPGSKHCGNVWAHDVEWWPGECANCRKSRTAGNQIERSSGRLIRWMGENSNPTSQGLEEQRLHKEMAAEDRAKRKVVGVLLQVFEELEQHAAGTVKEHRRSPA